MHSRTSSAQEPDSAASEASRASAWLAEGLETLIDRLAQRRARACERNDFDVLIVGSGYGAAVALSRLAGYGEHGRRARIGMLERGEEYLPGSFPARLADLAGHVRFSSPDSANARGSRTGLYDLRLGPDVHAIVANGLGGGSLINAGVMEPAHPSVFEDQHWPGPIRRNRERIAQTATALQAQIGVTAAGRDSLRGARMRELSAHAAAVQLAVQSGDDPVQGLRACIGCGDCFSGCNHGAKRSLDATLLAQARRAHGDIELYTGATVLSVRAADSPGRQSDRAGDHPGWEIAVAHTDAKLRERQPEPLLLRARRVVLAAGTFGSTEILMRSAQAGLRLSPLLGRRFSANGDVLAAVSQTIHPVNGVAVEAIATDQRRIGPTITHMIDLREGDRDRDLVLQDIACPAPMARAFEEIVATAVALDSLSDADPRHHADPDIASVPDPNALDRKRRDHTLLLAMIGHDDADGTLVMARPTHARDDDHGDGALTVRWPGYRDDPRINARHQRLRSLSAGGIGGNVLRNPLWQPLPEAVEAMIGPMRGPLLTVHPLGGCAMGDNLRSGVVDHLGRVFDGDGDGVHDGLIVLDGSIVPCSLGINPALTIAALTAVAIEQLRDQIWQWRPVAAESERHAEAPPAVAWPRPIYAEVTPPTPAKPTLVHICERLRGRARLNLDGEARDYDVELELRSLPVPVQRLMARNSDERRIEFDPNSSRMVLSAPLPAGAATSTQGRPALWQSAVGGSLSVFEHEASSPLRRQWRGLWAWLGMRGLRDAVQHTLTSIQQGAASPLSFSDLPQRARLAWRMASRAGDRRLMRYRLEVIGPDPDPSKKPLNDSVPTLPAGELAGHKTLGYCLDGNPWSQLQQARITHCPGLTIGEGFELQVDLGFFNRTNGPLLKLAAQADMPSALADIGSLGLYLLRTMLHSHLWTFRKPDPAPRRTPARLPGALSGLPLPEVLELAVDAATTDGSAVTVRLSRYRGRTDSCLPPVLLVHGYSASGTTFAHDALPEGGLAAHLYRHGRDVWILDLRSSCGLPTATHDWVFEDMGYVDIPAAIDHIVRVTDHEYIDVVAHCMSAVMISLGLLVDNPAPDHDRVPALRLQMRKRIRRLVLSQAGPMLKFAPSNRLRSHLLNYLQHYLRLQQYRFRPVDPDAPVEDALDRLLASVPYPADEIALENPRWPPWSRNSWAGLRHRMDAFYGVTFKLANMDRAVLDRLDDFFGPMSMRTAMQVVHFVPGSRLTTALGMAVLTQPQQIKELQPRILSLHSMENGLVDIESAENMEILLAERGDGSRCQRLAGFGHQDSLIGRDAPRVYAIIREFLEERVS